MLLRNCGAALLRKEAARWSDWSRNWVTGSKIKSVNPNARIGGCIDSGKGMNFFKFVEKLYENILSSKLVREDNAPKMLDIVFDSLVFDIGVIWNFNNMTTALLTNISTDVASMLQKITKPVGKQIQILSDKLNAEN